MSEEAKPDAAAPSVRPRGKWTERIESVGKTAEAFTKTLIAIFAIAVMVLALALPEKTAQSVRSHIAARLGELAFKDGHFEFTLTSPKESLATQVSLNTAVTELDQALAELGETNRSTSLFERLEKVRNAISDQSKGVEQARTAQLEKAVQKAPPAEEVSGTSTGWLYVGLSRDGKVVMDTGDLAGAAKGTKVGDVKSIRVLRPTTLTTTLEEAAPGHDAKASAEAAQPVTVVKPGDSPLELPVLRTSEIDTAGSVKTFWVQVQVPARNLVQVAAKA